mmetsp:Transcript_78009/g.189003  ORF Transcript_78009/g.189003 Transcript_78009/m.189003 type:complete len:330 (+) Transcript_78009:853-1842(+)
MGAESASESSIPTKSLWNDVGESFSTGATSCGASAAPASASGAAAPSRALSAASTAPPAIAAPGLGCRSGCMASSTKVRDSGADRLLRCCGRLRPPAPPRAGASLAPGELAARDAVALAALLAAAALRDAPRPFTAAVAAATAAEARRVGAVRGAAVVRFNMQYHLFFTALSGLPGIRSAMALHLLPSSFCAAMSAASSSADQGPLFTVGSRLLTHRSRHCLALRPGTWPAMSLHTFTRSPISSSSDTSSSSSSGAQEPLISGCAICQKREHASRVRPKPSMAATTASQLCSPCRTTAARIVSRSTGDHGSVGPFIAPACASMMPAANE